MYESEKPPVLTSISPSIGTPGGVLVLSGRNFGSVRGNGSVSISGKRPTSSSYLEWTDTSISVQIPEDTGTGLVYVTTRLGRSDGILFTNKNRIPMVMGETVKPGVPFIERMSSTSATVGQTVTVTGLNFGLSQGAGQVLFTPIAVAGEVRSEVEVKTEYLPASELDFDYLSWTDQEIRVCVPDGATSGNVFVETDRGISNSVYLEVTNLVGTKILREARGYQILFSVQVTNVDADPGSTIDIWVPGPLKTLEQRNIEYLKIPDPLWDDHQGLSRYHIVDPAPGTVYRINQTFWLDRYGLETKINTGNIVRDYDTENRLYRTYTAATELIPAGDESLVSVAKSAVGREQNPYLKAKAIYLFLLKTLVFDTKPAGKTIQDNFIGASADAYSFSFLFCALTRAVGVPSRPVAGFLVFGERRARIHYWAEFYLPGFGWVPVDLSLGDGATFDDYPAVEEPENFFFGNVDPNHIVFTRGVVEVKALSSDSRTVRRDRLYSLQSFHEESSAGVRSYTATWNDLQVIDIW
ncbi:MAG: IPT/TIG domain-containing protein [Spirochaetales bacterium]|nr:IPT/TIG domain-containing protein [Spirochaetales bacterium]